VACRLCESDPHQRACPVRLAPGWLLPPRVEPGDGPWVAEDVSFAEKRPAPGRLSRGEIARQRSELTEAVVAMRGAGHSWRAVAEALRITEATAFRLRREALGTADGSGALPSPVCGLTWDNMRMNEQEVAAAMAEAHWAAEQHQQQGTGRFVCEAHVSQLPGSEARAAQKDPGSMGSPEGGDGR
jgi:hypothetical protein